ncbi:MAG: hypothetical protein AUK59_02005 [Candidatus Altarchaeum sp. CG2_30_32_3053]|nr:MAG: hypothetical protein AUK59_02005 [Candidatus Altarchaeum sp. CG2_30_32_3053]
MSEPSALLRKAPTLTGAYNSGHTVTLRSAQMLGFASHFARPQPLYDIAVNKYKKERWIRKL